MLIKLKNRNYSKRTEKHLSKIGKKNALRFSSRRVNTKVAKQAFGRSIAKQ